MEQLSQFKTLPLYWVFLFLFALLFSYFLNKAAPDPVRGDLIGARNWIRKSYIFILITTPLILSGLQVFLGFNLEYFLLTKLGRILLVLCAITYFSMPFIIPVNDPSKLGSIVNKFSLIGIFISGLVSLILNFHYFETAVYLFSLIALLSLIVIYRRVLWDGLNHL